MDQLRIAEAAPNGKQKKWTARDLERALQSRYPGPAYVFLPQVASGTGGRAARTADAIVMSVWPSRGLELIGFEIKISRSDWLTEFKRPEKAEAIAQYCDRWYMVCAAPDIIRDGELPPAWGLMVPRPNGRGLVVVKEAPMRTDVTAMTRTFLAAVLRNAMNVIIPKSHIDDEMNDQFERGKKAGADTEKQRQQWLYESQQTLEESIKLFQEISGIDINQYNGKRLGHAVNLIMANRLDGRIRQLENLRREAAGIVLTVEKSLEEFRAAEAAEDGDESGLAISSGGRISS